MATGVDVLAGAVVVVALLGLARKLIRLAGEPDPGASDRSPLEPQ
jgi:hypothetical protein